ncbi:MAG TPA: 4-hydroxybenzoate octaprenyltransferase [Candidatus Cybelea sp.]|nr:4-hydroxybenzoate octaprenyltransferase [Candidatus Cybelea sp.]
MSEFLPSTLVDARPGNWVDRFAPAAARPYFRLSRIDRPIGTWLLLLPGWWSIALAAPPGAWPDLRLLALFAIGAMAMRGAGCTFNDLVDRDLDAKVERTRGRPLPSGQVGVAAAIVWLVAQCLVGLGVLLCLNPLAIGLGVASLLLVAVYPFMKRLTWWPQFFLGLAFNWGAILGWAAARDGLALAPLVLYGAGIAWTLGYDTIYAHQDKEDDALIGVKSTARLFGTRTQVWLAIFYDAALGGILVAGLLSGMRWTFAAMLSAVLAHFIWQVVSLRIDEPADCLAKFRSNRDAGLLVFAAIVIARALG